MSNQAVKIGQQFITTEEAAKYLRLKRSTLEVWRVQGRGPVFVKFGGAVRYRVSDLEMYASACTHENTSQYSQTTSV